MRLLCLVPYPTEGPSNRYRVEQFLPYLKERGIEADLRPFMTKEFFRLHYQKGGWGKKCRLFLASTLKRTEDLFRAKDYDGFLVHLEAFPLGPPVFEWFLSKYRKPILFDFEDAIYMPDPNTHPFMRALKYRRKFYKILKLSQQILVCNPYVKELVEKYNRHVTVLPTSIDIERFTLKSKSNGSLPVIGWIGSRSTLSYLLDLKEVFQELSKRYPFVLRIIGGGLEVHMPGVRVENRAWRLETEVKDFQGLDIGVYPLPDNEWARAKTPFKSIQYMSVGVPVVVSPVGGNRSIVQEGHQGYLADSREEWIEKLSRLLVSAALRETMGREGRKRVEACYSLQENQSIFCDVVERVLTGREGPNRGKRIFHVITDLDVGGTPISLQGLVERMDRSRFQATVISLKKKSPHSISSQLEERGIRVIFLNAEKIDALIVLYRFYLLLRDEKPTLLHTWLFHANLMGRLAARLAGVPIVVSSERTIDLKKGLLRVYADRLTHGLSDSLLANSEAVRQKLHQREKVPLGKIRVIRNGIDTTRFNGMYAYDTTFREREGFGKDALLVGTVARLHPVKGHCFLLNAFKDVADAFPSARLLLVGDGPLRTGLVKQAKHLGVQKKVVFLGVRRDITSILSQLDLFVLPSLEEGMPSSALEAMAMGRALVASAVGGICEILEQGQTGWLVPPGDVGQLAEGMISLLRDAPQRKRLGEAARKKAKAVFDIRPVVSETEELYGELLKERMNVGSPS